MSERPSHRAHEVEVLGDPRAQLDRACENLRRLAVVAGPMLDRIAEQSRGLRHIRLGDRP